MSQIAICKKFNLLTQAQLQTVTMINMEIAKLVDVEYDSVKITTARLPKRTKIPVRILEYAFVF